MKISTVAAVSVLVVSAVAAKPQTETQHLEFIGGDFFVDISNLRVRDNGNTVIANVLEKDSTGKTIASFDGVFNCLTKILVFVPFPRTPQEQFQQQLTPTDPDSEASKKVCGAAHVDNREIRVKRAVAAALVEAKATLATSRWVLVAGNPFFAAPINDTNKVAIFIDKESIVGVTAHFAVYPLDRLFTAMRADPRAWLLDPQTLTSPGYPTGKEGNEVRATLVYGVATEATQHTEPSVLYDATYDCENQTVHVSSGGKEETGALGSWGADPRNISIAARYFCPNYSVAGVRFYKLDK